MASNYLGLVYLTSVDGTTVIALDATESVDWVRSVSVSTSTIFNGAKISDHVHPDLPSVSFSGVISFSKIRDDFPTPDKFMVLANELIDSFQPMTFYGTEDGAIPSLAQCYITDLSVNRGMTTANALAVNISLQAIDISTSIEVTRVTQPSVKTNGQLSDEANTGDGTKTEVSDVKFTQQAQKEGLT